MSVELGGARLGGQLAPQLWATPGSGTLVPGAWKTHPASRGLCFLPRKQSRDQSAHPRDGGTSELDAGGGPAAHGRAAVNARCLSPPRTPFPQTHTGSAPSLPIPSFSDYKLILSKDLSVASGMWCKTHRISKQIHEIKNKHSPRAFSCQQQVHVNKSKLRKPSARRRLLCLHRAFSMRNAAVR